jgi:glycosyltransferase involved in cell wall biosynthesis
MTYGLISYDFPPQNSAPAARVGPFAEAWSSEGHTVHVFTRESVIDGGEVYEERDGIYVHRTPYGAVDNTWSLPARFLSEVFFCASALWLVCRQRLDVFVGTSPPFPVAVVTLLASKLTSTPYVVDVRDIYPEILFATDLVDRDSWFGRFLRWVERHVYDHALLVTSVTEGLCDYVEQRTDTDVILVRNGIDRRHFVPDDTISSNTSPSGGASPTGDGFVVLFHGTLGRAQNVELLLQYGRHLKRTGVRDVMLRVIGDGPRAETLTRGIDEYDLEEHVEYLGRVDFDDIPDHLHAADVGLSPRLDGFINQTAFPVKVYECLSCGLPVVVTPESEAGEFVVDHRVGFQHSNDDVKGIHESIMKLREDPSLYREYSQRAIRVSDSFDRHSLARELADEITSRVATTSADCGTEPQERLSGA